jgi:hypothetical protein
MSEEKSAQDIFCQAIEIESREKRQLFVEQAFKGNVNLRGIG